MSIHHNSAPKLLWYLCEWETLFSQEGTQGDPLAMSMYGIALLPLMDLVNEGVLQIWYADDGNAAGSIESLRNLFGELPLRGPAFGYNISKWHLITKVSSLDKAKDLFKDEVVELIGGLRILRSVIGSSEPCHAFQSSTHRVREHCQQTCVTYEKVTTDCLTCIY